jgi:aurora kinase
MIKTESSQSEISVNSLENLSDTNSPIKITNAKSCQEIDLINAPTTSKTTSSCVRPPIPGLIFRKKTLNSREDTKCSSARFGTSSEKSNSPTKPWRRALTISDFMIGKKLGNGRYGDVFAAKHKELGFVCAMKIISKNLIR